MKSINQSLFRLFHKFNWYKNRNYHCYICGRNHLFLTLNSRRFWVRTHFFPCKSGHQRTFSPAQWEVINRLAKK